MRSCKFISLCAFALLLAGCGFNGRAKFSQLRPVAFTETPVWTIDYDTPVSKRAVRYLLDNKPYTGEVIDYYPVLDVVRFKGYMESGLPSGQWTYYFSSGKIKMQGRYVNGNPDSIWQKYYYNNRCKVTERYRLFVDTVFCDTIALWYKDGRPCTTNSGDTFISYYPNGKWSVFTIGKPVKNEWHYTDAGVVTSAYYNYRREEYRIGGQVTRRIYFTKTEDGRSALWADGYNWSAQQRKDIAKADSVEFVYDRPNDPLVKIYWGR